MTTGREHSTGDIIFSRQTEESGFMTFLRFVAMRIVSSGELPTGAYGDSTRTVIPPRPTFIATRIVPDGQPT
jgi:hypothetical protein